MTRSLRQSPDYIIDYGIALNDLQIEEILPHFFDSSPHLSEILLARNCLSRVNDGTFGLLTRLALLDLSRNSLMKLEDNVLVGMTVHHLDLGSNSIDVFGFSVFFCM